MKAFALCAALCLATPGLAQNLSQEPTESIPVLVVEETAGPYLGGIALVLAALAVLMLAAGD
jgi:hypothetical protein